MLLEIVHIVLPVFLVILLGFSLKRTRLLSAEFMYDLNRLIYFIALPSLLFYKISTADFAANFNVLLLVALTSSTLFGFLFSYGYATLRAYPPSVKAAFCQGAFRGNLAYVGLAIILSAYGEEGFTKAGILLGFLVPLLNILSVFALTLPHRKEVAATGARHLVRQILLNPLIIASMVGICWSYLKLPLPEVLDRSLDIITGMSLPLALLSIGASFTFSKLRGDIVVALFSTTIKILILPLVAGSLLFLMGVTGADLGIGMLLAGTPTATAAYIMAQQLDADAELSGAIIMLSTLCSIGTYTTILLIMKTMSL